MPSAWAERLPYLLHTNREFGLMMQGKKPLASFADAKGRYPSAVERYIALFDRHIESGRFVRRDHYEPPCENHDYTLHRILIARPSESWRIDAMIELMANRTWSKEHERREGELLGYEDWMNDAFLALKYPDD